MSPRTPKRRVSRPVAARPRDAKGRWLSKRQIVALKGARTRKRKQKAKQLETARIVKAARHGERARIATTRKLTPAQVDARRRDARRVAQKVRRAKKDGQTTATRGRLSRSKTSPRSKARSKITTRKRAPNTETHTIGRGDKFAAQIGVRFEMPDGFKPTPALVRAAIRYRIKRGHDAPRTHTRILRWRNPGRRQSEDRAWRQGNQSDAWTTLGQVILSTLLEGDE